MITPDTTFPDQPQQESEGSSWTASRSASTTSAASSRACGPLSEALQVSSNIFFAHVGLELGGESVPRLRAPLRLLRSRASIGPPDRALAVASSDDHRAIEGGDCAPFSDSVELASAAFGQGRTSVTPLQMALVAAAIAGGGVMPHPYVVRDVRAHSEDGAPSDEVLDTLQLGRRDARRQRLGGVARPVRRWSTR